VQLCRGEASCEGPKAHPLGSYPTLSLAEARIRTPKVLTVLMSGADPKTLVLEQIAKATEEKGELF